MGPARAAQSSHLSFNSAFSPGPLPRHYLAFRSQFSLLGVLSTRLFCVLFTTVFGHISVA